MTHSGIQEFKIALLDIVHEQAGEPVAAAARKRWAKAKRAGKKALG